MHFRAARARRLFLEHSGRVVLWRLRSTGNFHRKNNFMPFLRHAGRQFPAVHHVGRNFKNQLPRQGSTVAVHPPGHSQKALFKQGNFLQGGGTTRSIAFQQERTGRKDGRRVRQPYFRIPGSHGRQQAQNRQPDHGRLDNGTTVSF